MDLAIVTVPYRYDEPDEGLGAGPNALLRAGLIDRLQLAGVSTAPPVAAQLRDEEREPGRVAVNIGRLGARTAALVAESCRAGRPALVLAGDDTAAVGVVSGAQLACGAERLGLVWLDAHGDFNTPETSYSGILAGMPVAILAGLAGPLWREASGLIAPIPTDRIVLAGVRDLDEQESALLRATAVRIISASEVAAGEPFTTAIASLARRCDRICLHVDLDVLDPRFVPSASTPSANGLTVEETARALAEVLATGKVSTLCVSSLNPGAGVRGERSLKSTLAMLERALPAWWTAPPE
ncbi:MAG: arginase family protein [Thermomicrobiales bacterium]|nr:arginase family protein [Thermomicrobiales bacterium]